ncbi:type II toxin-antitoxin system MqsR family toxin [Kosakonia cowanii]|jgi:motility quorum-sensing regulator/GCU-specific mRNA interferase toxin|uniref:type II toxin-antitoxin system MqsR family toxin n=1 Tax=Kosakonia cowanii TaxID=208223 RepID=UPI0028ACAA0C|nr:type II toxin-antitoxin system MqsR family toxin [Kosakonia cowanii]
MEKGTPHVRLHIVKRMVLEGKVRTTASAVAGAIELGFNPPLFDEMCAVIQALTSEDFFKSMTAYVDHTVWHDVYRPVWKRQKLYLKLIVSDDVLIVSFKER